MEEGRKQWQKGEIISIGRESLGLGREKAMARERDGKGERTIAPRRE
jgi:hypothetical protein